MTLHGFISALLGGRRQGLSGLGAGPCDGKSCPPRNSMKVSGGKCWCVPPGKDG